MRDFQQVFVDAIIGGNVTAIDAMVADHNDFLLFVANSSLYLNKAYEAHQLGVAQKLVEIGAEFNVKYLLTLDYSNINCQYLNHITAIRPYLTAQSYEEAANLIMTLSCAKHITIKPSNSDCYNLSEILTNVTITNVESKIWLIKEIYNELFLVNDSITQGILQVTAVSGYFSNPFIFMPMGTYSYLESASVHNSTIGDYVYMPISNFDRYEKSFLMHELGHYTLFKLFGHSGCPYANETQKLKYDIAAKESLLKVFAVLNITINNTENVIQSPNITLQDVLRTFKSSTVLSLFDYYAKPDDETALDKTARVYLPSISTDRSAKKKFLDLYLSKYMKALNIDENMAYVLSRISDFAGRKENELCKELIVRIAELKIFGVSEESLSIFAPLLRYWEENISPLINSLRSNMSLPMCDSEYVEDQINILGDIESA